MSLIKSIYTTSALTLFLVTVASPAISQENAAVAPSNPAGNIAERLTEIGQQNALLSAEKAQLQLQLDVLTKKKEIREQKFGKEGADDALSDQSMPVVSSVEGFEKSMAATLQYGNGRKQTVRTGDKITGGWQIGKIDVTSVSVKRGGDVRSLAFESSVSGSMMNTSGQYGMPPAPFNSGMGR